jgi:hypothetical protein
MEPNQATQFRAPIATEIATADYAVADTDLAAVVAAWSELPEAIRTGILAMMKAASASC